MMRGRPNGRGIGRQAWLVLLALALAACASSKDEKKVDANAFPTQYKSEIMRTIARVIDDPRDIRDAYLSDPVLDPSGPVHVYYSCVRSNSKNLNQQYAGTKDRVAYFYGGHISQLVDAPADLCAKAAYKPFPELERLCQAPNKCG